MLPTPAKQWPMTLAFLIVVVASFFVLFDVYRAHERKGTQLDLSDVRVQSAIDKGVYFLYQKQMLTGEFNTFVCQDRQMKACQFDSSPFATAMILYSLKDIGNEKLPAMRKLALQFLLRAQDKNGLWRYWTSQNPRGRQSVKIDPDVDDLAVISFVLDLYGIKNDNARFFIDQNQNTDGLFRTWITRDEKNDVDCVVNANVLLYLKQNDERVCSYINKSLQESSSCSPYYPNAFALPYSATRAQKNGITCFQESQQVVLAQILKAQRSDGSFGDNLSTALALNALLNIQYGGPELFRAAKYLVNAQRPNGSWDRSPFFTGYGLFFGSEELTTAVALEGLHQIVNR